MGQQYESLIVARAALSLAMSPTRERKELKEDYLHQGIKGTAVDFGENLSLSCKKCWKERP